MTILWCQGHLESPTFGQGLATQIIWKDHLNYDWFLMYTEFQLVPLITHFAYLYQILEGPIFPVWLSHHIAPSLRRLCLKAWSFVPFKTCSTDHTVIPLIKRQTDWRLRRQPLLLASTHQTDGCDFRIYNSMPTVKTLEVAQRRRKLRDKILEIINCLEKCP